MRIIVTETGLHHGRPTPKTVMNDVTDPAPVSGGWPALLARIDAALREQAAHPARSVVLLPYAQLLPLAAQQWAAQFPDGFAPRFETTRSWTARVGSFTPGPHDWSGVHGRDWLTAAGLLEAAGFAAQRSLLTAPLLEQAAQLAPLAASLPPALRSDWMAHARAALPEAGDGPQALEALLARIATAWVGHSGHASDALFAPRVARALDALVIVPGLQHDPLADTLAEHYVEKATVLPLPAPVARGRLSLHRCADGEDEAERAAACVLRHVAAGRVPVALVAGDRALTRRINALLAARGLRPGFELRDETGWKLSTTHAAASLMAALHACAPRASSDAVLDWLKLAPVFDSNALRTLEQRLRQGGVRGWPQAVHALPQWALIEPVEALRAPMAAARPVAAWLVATRALLDGCGLWPVLMHDEAGHAVIEAIGLDDAALDAWQDEPAAQRRMGLAEFTHWVGESLEAASYRAPQPADAPVVVLPLAQLLGRTFAALVLPGADEQRLPAAPEPPGPWSAAQRERLHLPARADLQAAQQAAWALALAVAQVDVLWRHSDDSGQALLPSPLVQALQLQGGGDVAQAPPDPREPRSVAAAPLACPAPSGAALPVLPLSASSYDQLRECPYRFFALRQLGLQDDSELDVDIDKRDWGTWLHAVLRRFHEALQSDPGTDRAALLDAAALQTTREQGLDEEPGEFLPFMAAWPGLRRDYLQWLAAHEAGGAAFEAAEQAIDVQRGPLQLRGRIDRIDRLADGTPLLIDYKTEALQKTKDRAKAGSEDTQLPFYALLAGGEAPRALYLNLAERETPSAHEMPDLPALAALLYDGMSEDVARIRAGAPLPALGEGSVCDWCEARGLCRKDFWKA